MYASQALTRARIFDFPSGSAAAWPRHLRLLQSCENGLFLLDITAVLLPEHPSWIFDGPGSTGNTRSRSLTGAPTHSSQHSCTPCQLSPVHARTRTRARARACARARDPHAHAPAHTPTHPSYPPHARTHAHSCTRHSDDRMSLSSGCYITLRTSMLHRRHIFMLCKGDQASRTGPLALMLRI